MQKPHWKACASAKAAAPDGRPRRAPRPCDHRGALGKRREQEAGGDRLPSTSTVHAPQTPIPHVSRTDRIPSSRAVSTVRRVCPVLGLAPRPDRRSAGTQPLTTNSRSAFGTRPARTTRAFSADRLKPEGGKRRSPGARSRLPGVAALDCVEHRLGGDRQLVTWMPERAERVADRGRHGRDRRLAEAVDLGARPARRARASRSGTSAIDGIS